MDWRAVPHRGLTGRRNAAAACEPSISARSFRLLLDSHLHLVGGPLPAGHGVGGGVSARRPFRPHRIQQLLQGAPIGSALLVGHRQPRVAVSSNLALIDERAWFRNDRSLGSVRSWVQIPRTSFRIYPVDGIGKKPPKPPSGFERRPNFASRLQRQLLPSRRTKRVALTNLQRILSDFRDRPIYLSSGRVFDPGSNCATRPAMGMQPVVAHVKRVAIRICDACPAGEA
jgi:hypothetical protein